MEALARLEEVLCRLSNFGLQLKAKCTFMQTEVLGFPTEDGRFVLDTDASLFAVGGVLSQLQKEGEVVIAYASRSLRLSQRRNCTTHCEMLAAVVMCTHFRSYLRDR